MHGFGRPRRSGLGTGSLCLSTGARSGAPRLSPVNYRCVDSRIAGGAVVPDGMKKSGTGRAGGNSTMRRKDCVLCIDVAVASPQTGGCLSVNGSWSDREPLSASLSAIRCRHPFLARPPSSRRTSCCGQLPVRDSPSNHCAHPRCRVRLSVCRRRQRRTTLGAGVRSSWSKVDKLTGRRWGPMPLMVL